MPRGVQSKVLSELLLALEKTLTVLSVAFNLWYFLGCRARRKGRRIAVLVLVLVNLSFLAGALYPPTSVPFTSWSSRSLALATGLLPMTSALAMTGLIWRQMAHERRRHSNGESVGGSG